MWCSNSLKEKLNFDMIFRETKLPGVLEVYPQPNADERGFFARSWCQNEFERRGLNPRVVQCNISFNVKKGTLRGIHYQDRPYAEDKLVRCTKGSIYDVVVDLRPQLPSFKEWIGVVLTGANRQMLYVPEGCAHGFLTLEDETEVFYQMSQFYHPELARGVRWNDPAFKIAWPVRVEVISERDRTYPDFEGVKCG
jgi:dTDP-4-dehydrorhamnose 3,5-epimerase